MARNWVSRRMASATFAIAGLVGRRDQLFGFGLAGDRCSLGQRFGIGGAGAIRRRLAGQAGVPGLVGPVDIDLSTEGTRPDETSLACCKQQDDKNETDFHKAPTRVDANPTATPRRQAC